MLEHMLQKAFINRTCFINGNPPMSGKLRIWIAVTFFCSPCSPLCCSVYLLCCSWIIPPEYFLVMFYWTLIQNSDMLCTKPWEWHNAVVHVEWSHFVGYFFYSFLSCKYIPRKFIPHFCLALLCSLPRLSIPVAGIGNSVARVAMVSEIYCFPQTFLVNLWSSYLLISSHFFLYPWL